MMNIEFKRKLPTPQELMDMYPLSQNLIDQKAKNDQEIQKIFRGEDNRFILIIGPCSADREDSVLEYISKLREVQEKVKEKIVIIPRIYTNKPRTIGIGYKGMLHQSNPNGSPDMLKGLMAIRRLHINCLERTGFSGADEMLYPDNHRYLGDVLSYVAIGARSVENQQHRLTASALNLPVGMKNPTSGDFTVMLNAIKASQNGHTFSYGGWEVQSNGNDLAHAVLRGYVNTQGESFPNYHYEDLIHLAKIYNESGLKNPAVIIDTNHSNSGKKYLEQDRIAKEILHSMRHSSEINKMVKGLMIESYLVDGCQKIGENMVYGQSITDPCLGWEKTERMILDIAEQI